MHLPILMQQTRGATAGLARSAQPGAPVVPEPVVSEPAARPRVFRTLVAFVRAHRVSPVGQ
jgi:hypothetical protein